MGDVYFAIPGDLDTPTGGYAYDRRLIAELPAHGWTVHPLILPGNYPNPTTADLERVAERFASLPRDAIVLVDGLMFGALPPSLLSRFSCCWLALVHHPLAYEIGLSPDAVNRLRDNERATLAMAQIVVTTSRSTAESLCDDYGVADNRLVVALPGQDPVARATGSGGKVPNLLTVGAVTPRKAYPLLIDALARLRDLDWRCRIVGDAGRDPTETVSVRAAIARHGLDDRIDLAGALDDAGLADAYRRADLYLSSAWYEGYGMALAAAVAHGLPIVACAGGAVGATVPAGAGILVPVGDAAVLAAAVERLLRDPAARTAYGGAAWKAAAGLPRWSDTATRIAAALGRVSRS